jgi:heat shock protein HtpX
MVVCPQCQTRLTSGKFCPDCGTPLIDVGQVPSAGDVAAATQGQAGSSGASLAGARPQQRAYLPSRRGATMSRMMQEIASRERIHVPSGTLKRVGWFLLVNAAIVASLVAVSAGAGLVLVPAALVIGMILPFFYLMISKWSAIRSHQVKIIDPAKPRNQTEADLYALVASISQQAGLERVPEVGWYESADMNAFATGMTRNNSLVAFSSALIAGMDGREIAAVAAHEIAHIANGDMVTLALVQSAVNAIVFVITIPLWLFKVFALFSDKVGWVEYVVISFVKWIVTTILVFLASLVVKGFSRRREFGADRLAATLVDRDAMIRALEVLSGDDVAPPKEQAGLAAFKIKSQPAWWDLFSTHPSVQRRIAALSGLPQYFEAQ